MANNSYKLSNLKRNPKIISSYFKIVGETTLTTENIKVLVPTRYLDKKLCIITNSVKVLSVYMVIDNKNNYGIVSAPIMQDITPVNISNVSLDGVPYIELEFNKGDVFIPNNNLIMSDTFMYDIFDEFYIKGNVPSFLDYMDVRNLMLETKKYANSNIGNNPLIFELFTSIISRDPKNKKVYYRNMKSRTNKTRPTYVGLSNIYYSYDNTGAKLIGGYFGEGITTAIVEPETRSSDVSNILRS